MNKLFTFIAVISLLISCSNELTVDDLHKPTTEFYETETFCLKIDSINNKYELLHTPYITKGPVLDYAISTPADAVGGFIGSKLCSWAGASVGAACGNPVIAGAGYLVGRKVGKMAGSAVASIAVAYAIQKWYKSTRSLTPLSLDEGYTVTINDPNNITDGELHNLILSQLLKNIDKYITINDELNYDLLLEDAIAIESRYCSSEDNNELLIKKLHPMVIEQIKRIVPSAQFLMESNTVAFLDGVYNNLIPEINMTKVEFDDANILNEKTLSSYRSLDKNNMVNYSRDIDKVIDSSISNENLRYELKSSNSVMLNSTLIWREVK